MEAIVYDEPGSPDVLRLGEHPTPEPDPNEVLVRVHATALNRADTMQRQGRYPPPDGASPILGLEMAGTVEEVGENVIDWKPGDPVMGLLAGGGYAEYAVIHQDVALAIPPGLTLGEAAAIPEVFLTAFQALHWIGEVESGENVLIHAGASGVGTAAIQLVREAGAHPYVTASGPKHDVCYELGAKHAVNYREEDFAPVVRERTGGHGADLIIDFVGAPYFDPNLDALAEDGRVVMLSTLGGATVQEADLRKLFAKRATLAASTLRSRSQDYKMRLSQDFAADVLPLFLDGTVRPVIDSTFDWARATDAHRRMEANENAGKIVLRVVD